MTEPSASEQPEKNTPNDASASPPPLHNNYSALTELFLNLAGAESLPALLNQALEIAKTQFEAHAASILFQGRTPISQQIGTFFPAIAEQIAKSERTISERLKGGGIWRILGSDLPPVAVKYLKAEDVTVINTPLLKKTQVIGSLSLVITEDYRLSLTKRAELHTLARIIGYLASTSSELSLTQKRYKELDLLFKMGQALVTTFDISKLLDDVMRLSANVLNAAAASIMLIDENSNTLVFAASHSPKVEMLRKQSISIDEGIAGWVATHGRPTLVNDVTRDPRFNKKVDVRTGFLSTSIAAVPLKLKGHTVGVLEVLNKRTDEGFDDEDLQLMTSIAAQATIALENAKLYQNLRTERDKIIKAQEDVRKGLSRNLHDGTIQQLSAINMSLDYLQKLIENDYKDRALDEIENINLLVDKATKDARLVLFELRPLVLETQGLIPALERYVEQLRETEAFEIETHFEKLPLQPSRHVGGTIFSILQEAVNNAKKHASPSVIILSANAKGRYLNFKVEDDGKGFDVDHTQQSYDGRGSLGLLNMIERAELIEGDLNITSSTGPDKHGTVVTLSVPIRRGTTRPLKNPLIT